MKKRKVAGLIRGLVLSLAVCGICSMTAQASEKYLDGTYIGSGTGYGETPIQLSVTVKDDTITSIEEVSQSETSTYWRKAKALFDSIISAQSTEVDSVSGATYSSRGIKAAVQDALNQASDEMNADASVFESGTGSEAKPYQIKTVAQLMAFAEKVDQGETYAGKQIELAGDIDLTGVDWNPIGTSANAFAGQFSGAGYTIANLTIGTAETPSTMGSTGLFDTLAATAVIRDVTINNADINVAPEAKTKALAGILAGQTLYDSGNAGVGTTIVNCKLQGTVTVTGDNALCYAAGVTGWANQYATVRNTGVDVRILASTVNGKTSCYAGGITGLAGNAVHITNCYATGSISTSGSNENVGNVAGGIAGMQTGICFNCYSNVSLTNESIGNTPAYNCVGSICGQVTGNGAVSNAYYNEESGCSVAVGSGASNGYTQNLVEMTAEAMKTTDFAALLNANLYTIGSVNEWIGTVDIKGKIPLLSKRAGFYLWTVEDETVLLSNEEFVDKTVDATIFSSGEGTKESPYLISNKEQLVAFQESVDDVVDYEGIYLALSADIDLGGTDWNPIGGSDYLFQGSFDGQGHVITGLTIGTKDAASTVDADHCYQGFFGLLGSKAIVKNLGFTGVSIYVKSESSVYAGTLVGYSDGAGIDGCYATGEISAETTGAGNNFAGGLLAYMYKGYVSNSYTDTEVNSTTVGSSCAEAGGILALDNRSLVANCYSLGDENSNADRSGEGMAYAGGIAACNAGTMVNCYVTGNLTTNDYSYYAGSIAGMNTGIASIYNCYYNAQCRQLIGTQTPDPVFGIGTTISGGMAKNVESKTEKELRSQEFAETLNQNFAAFPVQVSDWLGDASLLEWTYDETQQLVVPGSSEAEITISTDTEESEETETVNVLDGQYYGRAYNSSEEALIVSMKVENNKMTTMELVGQDGNADRIASAETIFTEAVQQQYVISNSSDDENTTWIKNALLRAIAKAEIGDESTYDAVDASKFAGGDGSEQAPYQIATEEQLRYFASSLNEDIHYENLYVTLTADITLTKEWMPAGGKGVYAFKGIFDGSGHTIAGLKMGSGETAVSYQSTGLFANLNGATVKNLKVSDAEINNACANYARIYTAVLAGYSENESTIDNCSVSGTVTSSGKSSYVGGLIAQDSKGLVTNCSSNVDIRAVSTEGWCYAGGLFGIANRVTTMNSYGLGSVNGESTAANKTCVGGLAGMQAGIMVNCYAVPESVISNSVTVDTGVAVGRNTGIGYLDHIYGSSDTILMSGNTVLSEEKAVGTSVAGSSEQNVELMERSSMTEQSFADLLNQNLTDITLVAAAVTAYMQTIENSYSYYYKDTTLNTWNVGGSYPVYQESDSSTEDDQEEVLNSYAVSIGKISGGTVKADVTEAKAGDTVTVKVSASKNYTCKSVKVTAESGKEVSLTKKDSGVYTFVMPAEKVTITAAFLGTQKVTVPKNSYTKTYGEQAFYLKASTSGDGKLTYQTSNSKVAVISSSGKVTIKGAGSAVLTVKAAATANYSAATATVKVTVKQKAAAISGIQTSLTKTYGDKAFSLGAKTTGGKLTYKSSSTKVATVSSSGKVTIKGTGKTVITITAAKTTNYASVTKKVTITVKPAKSVITKTVQKAAKQLTVTWKKDTNASGYLLQYATNSSFKNAKTVTIKSAKTTSTTLKKLTKGKKYYIRVCAYKTVNGTKIKGAYSKSKTVKIIK